MAGDKMKIYILPICLVFSLIILSCSKTKTKDEIKVGMTYDEVENILGKPESIDKGYSDFDYDYMNYPKIKKYGQLLYVSWSYKNYRIDSLKTVLLKMKEKITAKSMFDTLNVTYKYTSLYEILFDASSGRVVKSDYFPLSIN